ncbi:FemAB family protein [Flavobacterium amniphilum]|uniref:FemAB family protein n=1 Tax=Flavobacterium amniphilum TaxID=1834035 RepID=UPI002029BEFC|nr:FemAB family protein [Flavobacterium amniphilum]MCL9805626.1 FemAB family protein [Flavobacterium amniphilum]
MKNYSVKKYQPEDYTVWNQFVAGAKNATFLFHRDFMEYHSDRFTDFSLLVFNSKGKLTAIVPANISGNEVISHQGLTYGGLVFNKNAGGDAVNEILSILMQFLKENEIEAFKIKMLPDFYSSISSVGLDYFLFQKGAEIYRKDMNLMIDYSEPVLIHKSKLKHLRKCDELELIIKEELTLKPFWEKVLIPRLEQKHHVKPVHTLDEIEKLKSDFPENIRQFSIYEGNDILAGITVFEFDNGLKSQYGATTDRGTDLRAMDFLFIHLIHKFEKEGKKFFDMGIVNEEEGKKYNKGLLKQKEELGCAIYTQDYYKITL